jgi:hypothetical protein
MAHVDTYASRALARLQRGPALSGEGLALTDPPAVSEAACHTLHARLRSKASNTITPQISNPPHPLLLECTPRARVPDTTALPCVTDRLLTVRLRLQATLGAAQTTEPDMTLPPPLMVTTSVTPAAVALATYVDRQIAHLRASLPLAERVVALHNATLPTIPFLNAAAATCARTPH